MVLGSPVCPDIQKESHHLASLTTGLSIVDMSMSADSSAPCNLGSVSLYYTREAILPTSTLRGSDTIHVPANRATDQRHNSSPRSSYITWLQLCWTTRPRAVLSVQGQGSRYLLVEIRFQQIFICWNSGRSVCSFKCTLTNAGLHRSWRICKIRCHLRKPRKLQQLLWRNEDLWTAWEKIQNNWFKLNGYNRTEIDNWTPSGKVCEQMAKFN